MRAQQHPRGMLTVAPPPPRSPRRQVIYHLNNRNEDQEFDLQDQAEHYESEIEQILRDAAERMNTFRAKIEVQKEQGLAAAAVGRLREEHEEERKQSLQELERLKREAKAREDALRREAETQIRGLSQEVLDIKQKFQEQLAQFTETVRRLEKDSEEGKTRSQGDAQAQAQAKDRELKEAVREGNQKYNEMLAARMAAEDELREKAEALEREAEILQQRISELQREVEEARESGESATTELEAAQRALDQEWKRKVEQVLEELQREKERTGAEAQARARAAEAAETSDRAREAAEADAKSLRKRIAGLEADLAAAGEARDAADLQMRRVEELQGQLAEAQQQTVNLKKDAEAAKLMEQRTHEASVALQTKLDEAVLKLQRVEEGAKARDASRAQEHEKALAGERSALADERAALAAARGALGKSEAALDALATAKADGDTKSQRLAQEVEELKRAAQASAQEQQNKAATQVGDLKKKIKALEAELAAAQKAAEADRAAAKKAAEAALAKKLQEAQKPRRTTRNACSKPSGTSRIRSTS